MLIEILASEVSGMGLIGSVWSTVENSATTSCLSAAKHDASKLNVFCYPFFIIISN
ncbi:MAG: hypothetical protein ACJA0E_000717 [Bermanella sp.]|jgi:hypothetical protein